MIKRQYLYLAFTFTMLAVASGNVFGLTPIPLDRGLVLDALAFACIGIIVAIQEVHAEQTREAIKAIHEEL